MLNPKDLYRLFIHRKDVFSQQFPSGAYFPQKREITLQDIQEHLDGEKTIGVYCLNTDNTVKWACVDLDGDGTNLKELKYKAEKIYSLFPDFGRMLEFSGRKGYHVWVFFDQPVTAKFAQTLVKARINRKKGLDGNEVFPKQTELNENRKYGNLVKLPCGMHRVNNTRSKVLKTDGIQ